MHLHCPKGCLRRSRCLSDGSRVIESIDTAGNPAQDVARGVRTPSAISRAYGQMTSRVRSLEHAPKLEFYDNLHGVGGLFIPDQWVIAVGVQDIGEIADRLLAERGPEIEQIANELGMAKRVRVTDARQLVVVAGTCRCIAHELGHAILFRGEVNPFYPDEEAGADYYAGKIDAARRTDWRLGEMFFSAIGCRGPSCSHPSPEERAGAYLAGYREQMPGAA